MKIQNKPNINIEVLCSSPDSGRVLDNYDCLHSNDNHAIFKYIQNYGMVVILKLIKNGGFYQT